MDFPGQGPDNYEGAGPLDVYYGSLSKTFSWAVVCSGVSAGHVFVNCLASTDGGKTYSTLGDGNAIVMDVITGVGFLSPEIGYLCCRYTNDNGPQIYITEDGANTWERLQVSLPAELDGLSFTPESPQFTESGVQFPMHVYTGTGEESKSSWYFMIDNGEAQTWICKTKS